MNNLIDLITRASAFTCYDLTPKEELEGSKFTELQRRVIQNQICAYAHDKMNLRFTPETPSIFLQQEAELAGKISALRALLVISDDANSSSSPL